MPLLHDVTLPPTGAGTPDIKVKSEVVGGAQVQLVKLLSGAPGSLEQLLSQDAFGRLRVSTPTTIFDNKQVVDNQSRVWDDVQFSGAGTSSTYNANQASSTLAVSNLTAGMRVRQTKRRFMYQPGKSQLYMLTFLMGAPATGITKRVGAFTANNGVFLEQTITDVRIVVRSFVTGSPVDTNFAAQANWNLDTLDGNGPSGITLDLTKVHILAIDYEWLGVGTVRVGFVINGATVYVHQFRHANIITTVYMSHPNLPIRYEISNSGAGGVASLTAICCSVMSEGGQEYIGHHRVADRGVTPLVTLNDTSIYPLIAIRLKAAYLAGTGVPHHLNIVCTSTALYRWMLIYNPTVVGTALNYVDQTMSIMQAAVDPTNATTLTGGLIFDSGFCDSGATGPVISEAVDDFALGSTVAGVSDEIVLAVQRVQGGAETFFGTFAWRENI